MPLLKLISRVKNALLGRSEANADKASGATKKQAASAGDFAAQEEALKPKDGPQPVASPGVMPDSTQELLADSAFKVAGGSVYVGATAIPPKIAALLMQGIMAEGVSDAKTLTEALADYIDEGQIEVLDVKGGKSLTWIRFHAGDTEVGYMYDGDKLHAIVSDGWINVV